MGRGADMFSTAKVKPFTLKTKHAEKKFGLAEFYISVA